MPAAMAGLSVLLETAAAKQQLQCAGGAAARTPPPQIISKATILSATAAGRSPSSPASSSRSSPVPPARPPVTCSSFLHRCFLCHRELTDGVDIYIYRGDRAFCSEECRCRHIMVEDDDGSRVAAAGLSSHRRQGRGGWQVHRL